jgi:hypothetical protein
LRELDEKVKTIPEVVDSVKAAFSAIPDIQGDMEQIKKDSRGAFILQQEYCNGFGFLRCKARPTVR